MAPTNDQRLSPTSPRKKPSAKRAKPQASQPTESTVIQSKRTKKPWKGHTLHLTEQQRKTLLARFPLFAKLKRQLEQPGAGVRAISVTSKELHNIGPMIESIVRGSDKPEYRCLVDVVQQIHQIYEDEVQQVFEVAKSPEGADDPDRLTRVYQFHVSLFDFEPPIWRRIQVHDCTLDHFHEHIQAAMGWENCHLYEFRIDKLRCGPDLDSRYEIGCVNSHTTRLSDIVPRVKSRKKFKLMYVYDFGDDWVHEVLLENTHPPEPKVKYPQCVAGERACPPEDCGGPYRYWDLTEAIRNPNHDQHEYWIDFVGASFNPEKFDARKATAAMRKAYSSDSY